MRRPHHPLLFCLLLLSVLATPGFQCGGGGGPVVDVSLNAIEDDLKGLLVVPPSGFPLVTVTFAQGAAAIDPNTFQAFLFEWGEIPVDISSNFVLVQADRAIGFLSVTGSLPDGTYALSVQVADIDGNVGSTGMSFAVRDFQGSPPIGWGQTLWLDFESDRDGTPGADFAVDLESFGLSSPVDPIVSAFVHGQVVQVVFDRVTEIYHQADPIGWGLPDPITQSFVTSDPGGSDVTQICIGGADPSGQGVIGSIVIDPQNGNTSSVECGTIPPTGIFPREMTVYQGQGAYQTSLAGVLASLGGTPVGEHALDPLVLDAAFDPQSATPEELTRWNEVQLAVTDYGNALGSIVAHEIGHALGLVAPGAPGVGLHGGAIGLEFSHDVTSDGTTSPSPNYLMKHGGNFSFGKLAGLGGNPLPFFRPLDHAYLRNRVVIDPSVTELLAAPSLTGISPAQISSTSQVTVTGSGFASTPSLRLEGALLNYELIGEQYISETEVRGWVIAIQVPDGSYDLVLTNPDGQSDRLSGAVVVGP